MPPWLMLLCAYLLVWVPLNFAALATRSLPSIDSRGAAAAVELVAHAVSAALCAAAGWMLSGRNPAGIQFGLAALAMQVAVTIQALWTSTLPRDVAPGVALPLALFSIVHASGWALYLSRSRRLRVWLRDV
jgi:hypothetical protein